MPNPDTWLSQVNRFQEEKRLEKSIAAGPLKGSNGSECRERLKRKCGAPDPRRLKVTVRLSSLNTISPMER